MGQSLMQERFEQRSSIPEPFELDRCSHLIVSKLVRAHLAHAIAQYAINRGYTRAVARVLTASSARLVRRARSFASAIAVLTLLDLRRLGGCDEQRRFCSHHRPARRD